MLKLCITALAVLFAQQIAPMQNFPHEDPWEEFELKNQKVKALHDAAEAGSIEQVKKLIHEGVDVNTEDPYKSTALFYAAVNGHEELCKLLIEEGATTTYGYDSRPIWKIVLNKNSPCFVQGSIL